MAITPVSGEPIASLTKVSIGSLFDDYRDHDADDDGDDTHGIQFNSRNSWKRRETPLARLN